VGILGIAAVAEAIAAVPTSFDVREIRGLAGRAVDLKAPHGGVTVLVFYSSECPISNAYVPTLNQLRERYSAQKLSLVGICVDPDLSDSEVAAHARDFTMKFTVGRDRFGRVAAKLGATVTPEAFVLDDQGRVRYHGRIDDQFASRRRRNQTSSSQELRDSVDAVLAGRAVAVDHAEAVGCPLPTPPRSSSTPTYCKDVAPILQKHCAECHRPGQIGPFALQTYEQARKRAGDLASLTADRLMPPWKADRHCGPKFQNDPSLSDAEIATLDAWAEAGAPEGDPADLPPPVTFADHWQIGTPDFIIEPEGSFTIPANHADIYRNFVIPTNFPKDMDVVAIEYQPDNRRVVHHILGYLDKSGKAREKDAADPGPGFEDLNVGVLSAGTFSEWTPGRVADEAPAGTGWILPKGVDLVMQVHYRPSGKPETDRSRIGVKFAREPVHQRLYRWLAIQRKLKIPAGDSNYEVTAQSLLSADVIGYSITPHMHLLGTDMTMWAVFPDGHRMDLLRVPEWDFNWQQTYVFAKPIEFPRGTTLHLLAHYDNSAGNPNNPNKPPKEVVWGEATSDEMAIGWINVAKKGQDLTRPGERDDLGEILRKGKRQQQARDKK
jgi:hypothetical protein